MAGRFCHGWLLALIALMLSACASVEPRPGEARIPAGAVVTHRAVFIGTNNHDTTGTISLYQSPAYPVIVFEPNFSVSDAAGAVVALGTDGYRADTMLGLLLRPSAGRPMPCRAIWICRASTRSGFGAPMPASRSVSRG